MAHQLSRSAICHRSVAVAMSLQVELWPGGGGRGSFAPNPCTCAPILYIYSLLTCIACLSMHVSLHCRSQLISVDCLHGIVPRLISIDCLHGIVYTINSTTCILQYTSTSFMHQPMQLFSITCTQLNNCLEMPLIMTLALLQVLLLYNFKRDFGFSEVP